MKGLGSAAILGLVLLLPLMSGVGRGGAGDGGDGAGSPGSKDLEAASLAAVGLRRDRPARNGACLFDMPMTVGVDFFHWR